MTSRSRARDAILGYLGTLALLTLILAQWLHERVAIPVPVTLLFLAVLLMWAVSTCVRRVHAKARALQIAQIDTMAGTDFERYVRQLLTAQGYLVDLTRTKGDPGVDLIASRHDTKIAVQVKRQATKISRRAVSDAVAGMQHYRCNKAMVITNAYFSDGATMLARSTGCELIHRDALVRWIVELQEGRRQPSLCGRQRSTVTRDFGRVAH